MGSFTCGRCGQCCGIAPFNKREYKAVFRVAKNMGITLVKQYIEDTPVYIPRDLARKMINQTPEQITKTHDLVCPFLGKDGEGKAICRIYDLRPEVCRLFGTNPGNHDLLRCPYPKKAEGNNV